MRGPRAKGFLRVQGCTRSYPLHHCVVLGDHFLGKRPLTGVWFVDGLGCDLHSLGLSFEPCKGELWWKRWIVLDSILDPMLKFFYFFYIITEMLHHTTIRFQVNGLGLSCTYCCLGTIFQTSCCHPRDEVIHSNCRMITKLQELFWWHCAIPFLHFSAMQSVRQVCETLGCDWNTA